MIYDAITDALRDARGIASSQAQLRMIDRVTYMIADELSRYNRFDVEQFYDKAQLGYGVFLDNTLERNE
jgi:hypothetical protein